MEHIYESDRCPVCAARTVVIDEVIQEQPMINAFLTKHNLTQYRLAKLLNVTQTTVARWREQGPANPTILEMALCELERRL